MDTWNRLATVRGEGWGDWMKEGEETSQRTFLHNPQTQTTPWCWPGEGELGLSGAGQSRVGRGEMGTSVRVSTTKIKFKKYI